jgi:hypothetical protein
MRVVCLGLLLAALGGAAMAEPGHRPEGRGRHGAHTSPPAANDCAADRRPRQCRGYTGPRVGYEWDMGKRDYIKTRPKRGGGH